VLLGSGEGRKRSQLSIPATSVYTLGGHDIHIANMVGKVKPPGGAPEPCLLTKKPDGRLGMYASQLVLKNKFPRKNMKNIFRIFHKILKIKRIMPFCNLFMERLSYCISAASLSIRANNYFRNYYCTFNRVSLK